MSYLSARFPELELTFFNAGWGGDTAPNSLNRLERDVLSCQPTVVTLCFGMNDGSYCLPNETVRSYRKYPRNRLGIVKHPVAMRDLSKHLVLQPVRKQELTFLIAGWTARPLTTGERDKELLFTIRAADTGKSLFNIAAF